MSKRPLEIAPLLLGLLAFSALGVSAVALLIVCASPAERAQRDEPARSREPVVWPLAHMAPLAPLAEVELAADTREPVALLDATPLCVVPPVVAASAGSDELFVPSEADLLAVAPLPLKRPTELFVLMPAEPQWRAGRASRVVVNESLARRALTFGSFDSLQAVRQAGQFLGRGVAPRFVAGVTVRVAGATQRMIEDSRPRVADAGPTLRTATRVYRVTPVEPPAPIVAPTLAPPKTIVGYLGQRPSRGAFPSPTALAEQLDRVAAHKDLAPWAWDVAFRLRRLSGSSLSDPAVPALLSSLEANTAEAFAIAPWQEDQAAGSELLRAAYAIQRRTSAWSPERAETLAMLERRVSPAERLEEARWASAGDRFGPLLAERPARLEPLRIAQRIERYESDPSPRLARSLAEAAEQLAASEDPSATRLANAIDRHYRNANVRFAIAAELVERLIPQPEPVTTPVRDRIAGTPVTGRSTTVTRLSVKLTPDENRWRVDLMARGSVASRTYSRGGPAVLGSKGKTSFVAQKQILLTGEGIRTAPTVADAQVESQQLVSLKTNYDRVPLLNRYVRSTVRDEYRRVRGRAAVETRTKVEQRVTSELDQRVTPHLSQIEDRFASEVTDRFAKLGLRVDPVELRTTDTRLIGRVRVASHTQLAAHTPRMRAPSDSLLSIQLHESMLNNTLEGLGLAGETLTPTQLRERLTDKLQLPAGEPITGERVLLRFAADAPIQFRLADGQAELTLSLDELRVRGRSHRNFKVHAFYQPEVNGLEASLVRVGTPHIEGRMRTAARIHLHGVMGKVLGEGTRVPLIQPDSQTPDRLFEALAGLATNQFVIEDGWIGLAIGPERQAEQRVAVQVGTYRR